MSPTASPHFVELDPMHGGCPNEWNNYEDYEAEDLVAVVVSGGCEAPTTPKPTKSPLKLTPKPTNQFCFDTPAPSASPITPAPSKSPITPQPSASPSKNVRYYMFSPCLVNDRGGRTHTYSHVFSSRSYLSAFKESVCVSHYTGSFKVSYNTSAKCFSVQKCKIWYVSLCLVNDRGGLTHTYSHVFSSRSYLSAFILSVWISDGMYCAVWFSNLLELYLTCNVAFPFFNNREIRPLRRQRA